MDLIEDIGPILGIVAFLGFAILALLIVLQAREVRRLREWAGRAPERAAEADDAVTAATERTGESAETDATVPSRLAALRTRIGSAVGARWKDFDRRSPVHPSWILGFLAALALGLGIVTGGFGLGGGDSGDTTSRQGQSSPPKEPKVEVAVLNATQQEAIADPVPGVASFVADEIVKPVEGFKKGEEGDALTGEQDSVILFEPDAEAAAEELAAALEPELGTTTIEPMTVSVRDRVDGAPLALLVGFDDAGVLDSVATGAAEPATTP